MENIITYNVIDKIEDVKLRDYLKESCNLSTRLLRGASVEGRIKLNGKVAKLNARINSGDIIEIKIAKAETQDIEPEQMDIEVLYEDKDLIIVNKPPFLVVHPTRSHPNGTLANGILYHMRQNGDNSIIRLVSRLDMNTSGVITIAKNQFTHMTLAKQMESNTFKKKYIAIVHNKMEKQKDTINECIYRPTEDTMQRVVDSRGQESITHYEVLENYENGAVLKVDLETGRTHQIRVHLNHIGHPIFGDSLYGTIDEEFISRQALHAYEISFIHPTKGERVTVNANIPDDLKNLCTLIK